MISCIYAIENLVTGKKYIGSAKNFKRRKANHFDLLRRGRHHSIKLQRSYHKHGAEKFSIQPMIYCAAKDLLMYEQRAIDVYRAAEIGYNVNPAAGSNLGRRLSPKTRALLSAVRKGVPLPLSGFRRLGRKATQQHRENISAALKGKVRSIQHRERISASKRGIALSADTRAKMSAVRIGKKQSAETIAKRVASIRAAKLFSAPPKPE